MAPGIKIGCTIHALANKVMGSKWSKQRYGLAWKTKELRGTVTGCMMKHIMVVTCKKTELLVRFINMYLRVFRNIALQRTSVGLGTRRMAAVCVSTIWLVLAVSEDREREKTIC